MSQAADDRTDQDRAHQDRPQKDEQQRRRQSAEHEARQPDRQGPEPSKEDQAEIEERQRLPTPLIYEIIRHEGEEEMKRPLSSLWWSGIAAGLSMSFSLLAQGVLREHLPDEPWRLLIAGFGYSVGFLIVVLGRQQLFTENTITAVLPVIADLTVKNVRLLLRLWGIVFLANMVGTFIAALFLHLAPVVTPSLHEAMLELATTMLKDDWLTMFSKGIGAGFIVAAMVWIIPSAEAAKFFVILFLTYLIAVAEFGHIVAGSTEAFLAVLSGHETIGEMLFYFTLPVLLGNIVGGTLLVSVISYAQVKEEL